MFPSTHVKTKFNGQNVPDRSSLAPPVQLISHKVEFRTLCPMILIKTPASPKIELPHAILRQSAIDKSTLCGPWIQLLELLPGLLCSQRIS